MEFNDILKRRRSHRAYLPKEVDRRTIQEVLKASQYAPVSCNLQLITYIIIDDKNLLHTLAQKVSYKFAYAPVCVVVLNDRRFTTKRQSAEISAGMAVENIILKATELGLSTCPMSGFSRDDILREILNIPRNFEILLLVSIGYPDLNVAIEPSNKINFEDIYRYNRYDSTPTIHDSISLKEHTPVSIREYRYRISSVYLDRFKLNTFNDNYYRIVLDHYIQNIYCLLDKKNTCFLDVISYDGYFLKLLQENNLFVKTNYVSDYLESTVTFFKKHFPVIPVHINDSNNFMGIEDNTVECATFIFGLSFTPKPDVLLQNVYKKMKIGGILYCTVITESWYRRLGKFLINMVLRLKGDMVNIYEHNPFYKIGPYDNMTTKKVHALLSAAGFQKKSSGRLAHERKRGITLTHYTYLK